MFQDVMPPMATNVRNLAIQEITKNIQLYTEKPRKAGIDPKTLRYVFLFCLLIIVLRFDIT